MSEARLHAALEGLPYCEVRVVAEKGLMATRRATMASAKDASTGASVFIKCIWAPGPQAGPETQLLANPTRLARIKERLHRISQMGLPAVPVVEARLRDDHLLVVMNAVTIMGALLDGTPQPNIAVRILEELDPSKAQWPWVHFDICPRNTGLLHDGRPCLIDLDSVYFLDAAEPEISFQAAKWPRVPMGIWAEWVRAGQTGGAELVRVATAKHAYEVLLLAAEISFGLPATFRGHEGCADEWLLPWLADIGTNAPQLLPFIDLFRPKLVEGFSSKSAPSLAEVARDLRALVDSGTTASPAVTSSSVPVVGAADESVSRAARMRADQMSNDDLIEYDNILLAKLEKASSPELYKELVVLRACFLNVPVEAREIAEQGVAEFPEERTLREWAIMLKGWGAQ